MKTAPVMTISKKKHDLRVNMMIVIFTFFFCPLHQTNLTKKCPFHYTQNNMLFMLMPLFTLRRRSASWEIALLYCDIIADCPTADLVIVPFIMTCNCLSNSRWRFYELIWEQPQWTIFVQISPPALPYCSVEHYGMSDVSLSTGVFGYGL